MKILNEVQKLQLVDLENQREKLNKDAHWAAINRLNVLISNLLMPVAEVPFGDWVESRVEPENLVVGDHISTGHYVCKIDEVLSFEDKENGIPTFVFKCIYIGGDLSMFKYFKENINNGCAYGHRSHEQGNANKKWFKVVK